MQLCRSDDEPNVDSYLGRPINHQWTKSHESEAALSSYRNRWLPGAPVYSSPLRPLFELQIIASLSGDIDAYLRTASCNRTRGDGWCRDCAKCAWVFLAASALFGHQVAIRKTGGDMFANPGLARPGRTGYRAGARRVSPRPRDRQSRACARWGGSPRSGQAVRAGFRVGLQGCGLRPQEIQPGRAAGMSGGREKNRLAWCPG